MRLHSNYRYLLRKSWAIRWALVAGFFSGAEVIVPMLAPDLPRNMFVGLSFISTAAAVVARLLVQDKDGL